MTTTPTRLTPPARGNFPAVEGCTLRVYTEHQAMLSREAWEALGSPAAVAIEYDDRGYSIVPVSVEDRDAIRVYRHRKLSIGVIAGALRGSAFPLRIKLERETEQTGPDTYGPRLRFAEVSE
jgi:hypothetical protein